MEAETVETAAVRRIASSEELELVLPQNEKGLGAVILAPDSPELIAGVHALPFPIYPDDRGYFLEVQRLGRGLAADFPSRARRLLRP